MLQPEPDRLDYYFEDTIVVDWHTPAVRERAHARAAPYARDVDRARAVYEFVRDEIRHTADAGGDELPCRASHVLRAGTGIGFSKSHLLAALLRALGLRAGFAYQVLRRPDQPGTTLLYGFNGLWLPSLGRWVALDARGNGPGLDARFDVDAPALAVRADPDAGEFVYPTVYARPAPEVVSLLDALDSLAAFAPHVPTRLPGVPDPV